MTMATTMAEHNKVANMKRMTKAVTMAEHFAKVANKERMTKAEHLGKVANTEGMTKADHLAKEVACLQPQEAKAATMVGAGTAVAVGIGGETAARNIVVDMGSSSAGSRWHQARR